MVLDVREYDPSTSIGLTKTSRSDTSGLSLERDTLGKPILALKAEQLYAFGHLIRETERLILTLFGQGLISGTTHTAIGQELCQMAVVRALDDSTDVVLSNHRNHGHFLTYTADVTGLLAEVMGREGGVCGGRGGSQHIAYRRFHSNGVQGGMTAIGAGHGLALKLRGDTGIVAVFVGDGSLGEGLLYEALNLVGTWRVPVLFVVENNQIAQTTPTAWTTAGSIDGRGAAFGIKTWRLDDADPKFFEQAEEVVHHVRRYREPGWLVIDTRRLGPHSKGDDLRDPGELEEIRVRDPLQTLGSSLTTEVRAQIETANGEALARARSQAEGSPEATWKTRPTHAFHSEHCERPPREEEPIERNVRAVLNESLRCLLEQDPRVLLLGEDLHDPYGGAFKVTAGLASAYPGRVLSTPISEAGIVGAGIGLALEGFRPIVEIMFADFMGLAFDQLYNHAVKFPFLFEHAQVPLIVRTPSGGRRGYGPTHSQSPENILTAIPGLTVVYGSHRHNNAALLENASRFWPNPVVFLEHKLLYGLKQEAGDFREWEAEDGDPGAELFPTLAAGPETADVTLLTYGGMTPVVEDALIALRAEELTCEVVVLSLLAPLPRQSLIKRLKNRQRIVIAEESHRAFGVGAEIAASLLEEGFRGQLTRVGAAPVPIPSARSLEAQVLPGRDEVVKAVLSLF